MNNIILGSALFLLLVMMAPATAQQSATGQQNYVVLTKKVEQLKPLILSAEALKKEDGANFGEFHIVICGKNIGDVTNPSKMQAHIANAKKHGVKLIACGFSMKRFGVDASEIPDELSMVDNGILYNFQLQKKGYKSLGL